MSLNICFISLSSPQHSVQNSHERNILQWGGYEFEYLPRLTLIIAVFNSHFIWPQSCLRSVLEQIAAYGQVVFRLQEFIDEVMGHSSEHTFPGNGSVLKKLTEAPFRTYQAFMWALYKYFITFKEELTEIEKCIINNGIEMFFPLKHNILWMPFRLLVDIKFENYMANNCYEYIHFLNYFKFIF